MDNNFTISNSQTSITISWDTQLTNNEKSAIRKLIIESLEIIFEKDKEQQFVRLPNLTTDAQ